MGAISDFYNSNQECKACGAEIFVGVDSIARNRDYRLHECVTIAEKVAAAVRTFHTGATRDTDKNKLDYEAFFSPLVLERRAEYMHKHRFQSDGTMRDGSNWQKGIPKDAYMKSGFRHFMDWWKQHRGIKTAESLEESICALMFNLEGYLHETLKEKQ